MGAYLQKTIEAAKKVLADPMYQVDEDGRVWKRVGLPDSTGDRSISYRTGPKSWVPVPVQLLVYLKWVGDIQPNKKVSIMVEDGDPNNLNPKNLRLVERRELPVKKHISGTLRAEMIKAHEEGLSPIEVAERYGFSLPQVTKALFKKNGG